jgi:hypothetical protein
MYSKIITAVVFSAVFVAPAVAGPHQALVSHSHGATVAAPHGALVKSSHGALVTHGGSKIATKTH